MGSRGQTGGVAGHVSGMDDRARVQSSRSTREGYRRRRAERRRARRRVLIRRMLIGLLVLVAVGGLAFGVIRLSGRGGAGGGAAGGGASSGSTSPQTVEPAGVVLMVTQDASTAAVLFISPDGSPAVLVSLPGATLAHVDAGFATAGAVAVERGAEALAEVVQRLLGREVTAVADVPWAAMREAATMVGGGGSLPPALREERTSAESVLAAAGAVSGAAKTSRGQEALDSLALKGEGAEAVREALQELPSPPGVQTVVPGRWVERGSAAYYEPDPARIAALLGGGGGEAGVSVEVQNGSGEIGVAEAVSAAVASLGFTMLDTKNAEQFPDVAGTQILAAPDVLPEAERVRTLLLVGTVVERKEFPAGRIVVVVGKDLPVSSVPTTVR